MDHIGSILPKVLHRRGLHGPALAAMVTHRAHAWLSSALPKFSQDISVPSFKDGTLTIGCTHPVVTQECQPLLPSLQQFLERECHTKVRTIRMVRSRT